MTETALRRLLPEMEVLPVPSAGAEEHVKPVKPAGRS